MASLATWLRTASGALCALLLLILTLAPAIDSLVCGPEDAASVSALVGVSAEPTGQDQVDGSHHRTAGAEACAHGHCHHTAVAVPEGGATLAANAGLPLILTPDANGLPPSNLPDGPKEPPRA